MLSTPVFYYSLLLNVCTVMPRKFFSWNILSAQIKLSKTTFIVHYFLDSALEMTVYDDLGPGLPHGNGDVVWMLRTLQSVFTPANQLFLFTDIKK